VGSDGVVTAAGGGLVIGLADAGLEAVAVVVVVLDTVLVVIGTVRLVKVLLAVFGAVVDDPTGFNVVPVPNLRSPAGLISCFGTRGAVAVMGLGRGLAKFEAATFPSPAPEVPGAAEDLAAVVVGLVVVAVDGRAVAEGSILFGEVVAGTVFGSAVALEAAADGAVAGRAFKVDGAGARVVVAGFVSTTPSFLAGSGLADDAGATRLVAVLGAVGPATPPTLPIAGFGAAAATLGAAVLVTALFPFIKVDFGGTWADGAVGFVGDFLAVVVEVVTGGLDFAVPSGLPGSFAVLAVVVFLVSIFLTAFFSGAGCGTCVSVVFSIRGLCSPIPLTLTSFVGATSETASVTTFTSCFSTSSSIPLVITSFSGAVSTEPPFKSKLGDGEAKSITPGSNGGGAMSMSRLTADTPNGLSEVLSSPIENTGTDSVIMIGFFSSGSGLFTSVNV